MQPSGRMLQQGIITHEKISYPHLPPTPPQKKKSNKKTEEKEEEQQQL